MISESIVRGDFVIVTDRKLKTYNHVGRVVAKNAAKIFVVFPNRPIIVRGKAVPISFDRFRVDSFKTLLKVPAGRIPYRITEYPDFDSHPCLSIDIKQSQPTTLKKVKRFFKDYKLFVGDGKNEICIIYDNFRLAVSELSEDNYHYSKFEKCLNVSDFFQFMKLTQHDHAQDISHVYTDIDNLKELLSQRPSGSVIIIGNSLFEITNDDGLVLKDISK